MSTLAKDIDAAQAAVDVVLASARSDMIAVATGGGTASQKLAALTRICKDIAQFIARPFAPLATQNDTQYKLWPKHDDDAVNVAILRAAFASGSSQHEQVRLVVRQALSWDFKRAIDPAVLLP